MTHPDNDFEHDATLEINQTSIEGLSLITLPVRGDNRGWFKENWQREKMVALGLPDFEPVQNNISFNTETGTTRGLHAEPWDKLVSIGAGRVFGAWCDLRADSPTYGQVFTATLDPSRAIFVPRGVANGFQTLTPRTVYSYLVNDHWSPEATYSNVSIYDESLGIEWPIPLDEATVSDKDQHHPLLKDATPIAPKKTLIVGAYGQLGRALQEVFPDAECVDRDTLDISQPDVLTARRWKDYGLILNAAAYTAVDKAETPEGRVDAWQGNVVAVSNLARIALANGITLVHVSSDYVFDGTKPEHTEDEPFSPLGVYGQTKAAGDIVAATVPRHYIARTSWVIGDGNNFVRTMSGLAERGITPTVVDDQIGRLTFTADLAKAIHHLVTSGAPYGTYNVSNEGEPASWAQIAKRVYEHAEHDPEEVTPVSTEEYYAGKEGASPRPMQSTLDLTKLKAAGFTPRDWEVALENYLQQESK